MSLQIQTRSPVDPQLSGPVETRQTAKNQLHPVAARTDSVNMSEASSYLIVIASDPDTLLTQMQLRMRDGGAERAHEGLEVKRSQADSHKIAQEVALKKAEEVSGFLGISGFLGDLLKAVVVIATTVAAAVATGGAGAALAIAGAVLILAAEPIANVAADIGIISESQKAVLQLGIELVGAALTLGSGFAGGASSAASSATNVASTAANAANTADSVKTIASTIETVAKVLRVTNGVAGAVAQEKQTGHNLDAETEGVGRVHVRDQADSQIDDLRRVLTQHGRIGRHLQTIREDREEAQRAILSGW